MGCSSSLGFSRNRRLSVATETYRLPAGSGLVTIEGITRVHVREWRNWMKPRYAVSTTNRRLTALSSFLSWCVEEGTVQTNPVAKVKWLKQQTLDIKWLTPADEGRMMRYVERQYRIAQNNGTSAGKRWADRDRAIFAMLMYAGLRASEVCALNVGNVAISERKGHEKVIGKGNKERVSNLNADIRQALRDWLARRLDVNHEALFLGERGNRLSWSGLRSLVKRMVVKVGFKDTDPSEVSRTPFVIPGLSA